MLDLWDTEPYLGWFGKRTAGKESPWLHKSAPKAMSYAGEVGGGGFCKLLHTGTEKWSQAACLHCLEWPPLLVNVSLQLPSLQHLWRGLKLSAVRYTSEHGGHTHACRCSFNSSLLLMVGDGVPDHSLTIPSLEGIHYSVYYSLLVKWMNCTHTSCSKTLIIFIFILQELTKRFQEAWSWTILVLWCMVTVHSI